MTMHEAFLNMVLLKNPREVSGGVSFLQDGSQGNLLTRYLAKKKFKVSNRKLAKLATETLGKDVY